MNGIESKIDKLGRVVIPVGYRKRLGLGENNRVLISIKGGEVIISFASKRCVLCGKAAEEGSFQLCNKCVVKVKNS